jgi:Putative transposase
VSRCARASNFGATALEREGVLVRDAASSYLELAPDTGGPLDDLIGHSITYRVAVGPRAGQKVFSLQTVPVREQERKGVAQYAGFSLHAGIGVEAAQRGKLERLTRYVSRSPVAVERLDLTAQGPVRYRLKTPYPVERDERSGRDDAHRAGALGLHRPVGGAGAAAASASDEISRGTSLCRALRAACGCANRQSCRFVTEYLRRTWGCARRSPQEEEGRGSASALAPRSAELFRTRSGIRVNPATAGSSDTRPTSTCSRSTSFAG